MSHRSIAIVEASASRVSFARFSLANPQLPILEDHGTEAFPGADWSQAAPSALKNLAASGRRSGPVTLVVPPHLVWVRQLHLPPVPVRQRDALLRKDAEESGIPDSGEFVRAFQITSRGADGSDGVVVTARLAAVEKICGLCDAAGFTPVRVLASPLCLLAVAEAMLPADVPDRLVLNIGARSGVAILFADGRRFIRAFARSGQLPAHAGQASNPKAATIALVNEVTRTLIHFRRLGARSMPRDCLVTGGGAADSDVRECLAARLGIPATCWAPPGAVGPVDLLGAALDGSHDESADLLPRPRKTQLLRLRRRPWLAAAACFAALATVPPAIALGHRCEGLRAAEASLGNEMRPGAARAEQLRLDLAELAGINGNLAAMAALDVEQSEWLRLLADLQERLAQSGDVWLTRLRPAEAVQKGQRVHDVDALRLDVAGCLLVRSTGAEEATEAARRFAVLRQCLAQGPGGWRVEHESFERRRSALLRFDFTLVREHEKVR